ncbi:MAG: leucine-rich repeat protein [Clostridiales bacterium]|nr:leucine-rich repeat protein [Clostridiales bacterium]
MRLLKIATVALSIFAVVGITVRITNAAQVPLHTPTPGVTTVPTLIDGDYKYKVLNEETKECEITDFTGTKTEVIIPSKINGYKVTQIGYGAFDHSAFKSVQIPLSVAMVKNYAFGYCDDLEEVWILNKDVTILQNAFSQSKNIKTIVFPNSYADAKALVATLDLPENVEINIISYPSPTMSITEAPKPTAAEPEITKVPDVTVIPVYSADGYDYVVTDEDKKECEISKYTDTKTDISVPVSLNGYKVTKIGYGAFGHSKIKSVQIPLSVAKVDNYAFGYCDDLTSVMILNKDVVIASDAFSQSKNIKTVILASSFSNPQAFLASLNLPEGVQLNIISYPSPTITMMPKPTEATPTVTVTDTPEPTVTTAPTVTVTITDTPSVTVTVSPTPTIIVSATPTSTATPTPTPTSTATPTPTPEIIISATPAEKADDKKPATKKVSGNTYKVKGNTIELTAVSKKATKVVIPSTVKIDGKKYKVTSVSAAAFKKNSSLTSVTIGKNITSIAKNAFKGKSDLAKITVKSTVLKTIGKGAFSGIAKKVTVVIPKKNEKAYKKLFNKAIKGKITFKTV